MWKCVIQNMQNMGYPTTHTYTEEYSHLNKHKYVQIYKQLLKYKRKYMIAYKQAV